MPTTRRDFLLGSASVAALVPILWARTKGKQPRRILLRSSWQVVNIGDIAHTPGVLALLEKYLPDAEVRLWASPDLSEEVMAMEHKRFPKLRIVKGSIAANGKASTPELQDALEWCDFLLHGSGASLVAAKDVAAFVKHTSKPFGVYGITHGSFFSGDDKDLLSQAKFVFFRDSVSLKTAQAEGVKSPVMEFGPDGAFGCDLRNDAQAKAFLQANGLEEGKFLCCIPRLRYTPYWKIRNQTMTEEQQRRAARNDAMAEHDHAPLRAAITRRRARNEAQGAALPRRPEPDGSRQTMAAGQTARRCPPARRLARTVLADGRSSQHVPPLRRTVRPGNALAHYVHRQWHSGHRLPVRGTNQQRLYVARHRLGAIGCSTSIRKRTWRG